MLTITKRSGREEEFRPDKIQKSMRDAGVSPETSKRILGSLSFREGMTTSEVRNRVIGGIKNSEPDACKRYESRHGKT
jgi:hypothetical protein